MDWVKDLLVRWRLALRGFFGLSAVWLLGLRQLGFFCFDSWNWVVEGFLVLLLFGLLAFGYRLSGSWLEGF